MRANRIRENSQPDQGYTIAFRTFGLDLATTSLDQAITTLQTLPESTGSEVVSYLDDWASVYDASSNNQRVSPMALARGLDTNPDRNRLRTFLEKKDLKADAEAIRTMAKQDDLIQSGPTTALLLVTAIDKAEVGNNTEVSHTSRSVLQRALLRFPGDVWLNYEMAGKASSDTEKIRYASIARALGAGVYYYGQIFEAQRNYPEAEAIYYDETIVNPTNTDAWYLLFDLLRKEGKTNDVRQLRDRWINTLIERIHLAPDDPKRHFDLAAAYCQLEEIPNIIVEFREAARLSPPEGRIVYLYSLGRELLTLNAYLGAVQTFRDALQLDPDDLECLYHLAYALCLSGDHMGEVQTLREAIRLSSKEGTPQKRSDGPISESAHLVY